MKITFGRIFETSLVGKTKAYEELAPFVDWIQSAIDNMARALTSKLSLADNIDSQLVTQTVKSTSASVTTAFKLRASPVALLVAQQSPISPKLSAWAWQRLANGDMQAVLTFESAPTTGVEVRFLAFFS